MSLQAMQTISSRCRICGHFLIFIVFKNHCYLLRYKYDLQKPLFLVSKNKSINNKNGLYSENIISPSRYLIADSFNKPQV